MLGNLDEAIVYGAGALTIRLKIGTATAGDIHALAGLCRRIGRDRFRSVLASRLDEETVDNLMGLLDQLEEETAGD